jgi:hypothetical protein
MAPILTAEEVVRRIAAECAYVDDRGGVGIRLERRPRSCDGMGAISPAAAAQANAPDTETDAAAVIGFPLLPPIRSCCRIHRSDTLERNRAARSPQKY